MTLFKYVLLPFCCAVIMYLFVDLHSHRSRDAAKISEVLVRTRVFTKFYSEFWISINPLLMPKFHLHQYIRLTPTFQTVR